MRVLHLDAGQSFRGGQRQVRLLAAGQRADPELTIRVLACSTPLISGLTDDGVEVERWPGPTPGGLFQLARALARFAPDLVHAHDARAHGAARLVGGRSRLVVHRRIDDPLRDRRTTRWKYRQGTLICVSDAVRQVLLDAGLPAERLHVARSAVHVPAACPGRPVPRTPLRLLCVGALVEHKGHDVLLEALAASRSDAVLELAGDGPLADALRRQSQRLGLNGRVRFTGGPGARHPDHGTCDLFVHPSRTEGLGTAVLDAMAAACPVLASRTGGLPEIVREGRTGWLVAAADPQALAAAIDRIAGLARRDPDELGRLGRAGWQVVDERHRCAAMVAATRGVYDRLLEGKKG